MGWGWLAEEVSPDHQMTFDEPNLSSLEVIGWSSRAWGSMKFKVRTTWMSTGIQSAQVLLEHGGVAKLESGSFGTWCRLMSCGFSYEWSIFPLVCGKGWEMSSIPCASQAWSFLRTVILMAEVTPVCLDRWWFPKIIPWKAEQNEWKLNTANLIVSEVQHLGIPLSSERLTGVPLSLRALGSSNTDFWWFCACQLMQISWTRSGQSLLV